MSDALGQWAVVVHNVLYLRLLLLLPEEICRLLGTEELVSRQSECNIGEPWHEEGVV